jgi:hypothetical protein
MENIYLKLPLQLHFLKSFGLILAWAVLRCLVSMIYLYTKKSFPKTENLSRPSIYSLEIYSGTKNFLGLRRDLQTGLTVLGEDLAIS